MHLGTSGNPELIRVGLPLLAQDRRSCPHGLALRGRPLIQQAPERSRSKPLEDFALGPVMRALDAIEHDTPRRPKTCHPAHTAWSEAAVRNYLDARERQEAVRRDAGLPVTKPVEEDWVAISALDAPDARGARRYERTAWGRRYASPDGSVRELWLLSVNSVKKDRTEAEIVAAAAVAAAGVRARAKYGEPYVPVQGIETWPASVRVVAVGCGDGSVQVLAECSAQEARERYDEIARPVLTRMIDRHETNPGSDCVSCEGLLGCADLPHTPDILGVEPPRKSRKRRSISAADLRIYNDCPAAFHLTRVLHLKEIKAEAAPIRRGRAVDAWLNEQHELRRPGGCRDVALPEALDGLSDTESESALRMVAQHRALCPLDGLPDCETIRPQPRLTAYDPTIDVVVIADPDLLYTDAGGWVWRETKTATSRLWEGRPLLESFPQIALAVVLMAAGIPGGDPRRSRIELEILYEDGSACEEIDPFDEPTLDQASALFSRLAAPWASDEIYTAKPSRACGTCEVRRWCAPGLAESRS